MAIKLHLVSLMKKEDQKFEALIYTIRGHKVMLDSDLANLYQVETKSLNRAVRRNVERFPEDFMFKITEKEYEILRFQIGTLRMSHGAHRKYLPNVFTEHGIVMLSSVVDSPRAISVNVSIVRAFVQMRKILAQENLTDRMNKIEKGCDQLFKIVFERLEKVEMHTPVLSPKRRRIGI